MAGRNRWLVYLVLIGLVYWIVTTAWTGAVLARDTVSAYVLGSPQSQFLSDGKVKAALGNPDAQSLKVLPEGVGLAQSLPTAYFRPTLTFDASNADILVHAVPARFKVTLDFTWSGWRVSAMDRLP
jgi:hypothetical protein